MPDPTCSDTGTPASLVAVPLVRLLAAAVDVVADSYDPVAGEECLRMATATAAVALLGLSLDVHEPVDRALTELARIVGTLPPAGSRATPAPGAEATS